MRNPVVITIAISIILTLAVVAILFIPNKGAELTKKEQIELCLGKQTADCNVFFQNEGLAGQCPNLRSNDQIDKCLFEIAIAQFNPSTCVDIKNKQKRSECFTRAQLSSPEFPLD